MVNVIKSSLAHKLLSYSARFVWLQVTVKIQKQMTWKADDGLLSLLLQTNTSASSICPYHKRAAQTTKPCVREEASKMFYFIISVFLTK